jgi:hypothetical protein
LAQRQLSDDGRTTARRRLTGNASQVSAPASAAEPPASPAPVSDGTYLPHIDLLAAAMHIPRERLNSRSKIAIDARLLRLILQTLVRSLPFSEAFYRASYPDLAAAAAAGQIADLHRHYVDTGFFEGRIGAPPEVDEAFYRAAYPDIAAAIARGDVPSAAAHYALAGAAEGRVPRPALAAEIDAWMRLLKPRVLPED